MRKLTFLLTCLFLIGFGLVNAQTASVKGRVLSTVDNEPVVGATVKVKGATNVGTISDANGNFSISVSGSSKTLVVSYIGMKTIEVAAANNMVVYLETDARMINEVVVTAMGISRDKKSLGFAASTVANDELVKGKNTDVLNSLSGKVAGLQIQNTSSDPGAASSVVIRGFGSINGSNQPLYVVDGVPLQNITLNTSGHSISAGGIGNISSEDIASMTVLKGAASTALYGSRAANGVIVITTKQGKKSDGKLYSLQYSGGLQARQVSVFPQLQNEFGQGWNGAQTYIENGSWGPRLDGSKQVYGPIWNNQQLIHKYSAVENNVREFFETGWSQNHNFSISGVSENDKMNYYLSYSNTNDDGIMPTNKDNYKRNTLAYRSSFQATDKIKVTSSINMANASTDVVGSYQGTSVIDGLYEMPRDISILDMRDLTSAFNTPEAYFTPYGITNPYWSLENNYNHTNSKQVYGKVQLDVKPIKNVTLTYRFGYDYSDYDTKVGYPQIKLDDALIDEDYGYAPSNMNQDGSVYASYRRSYEINHDFLANFNQSFNEFKLNANLGLNVNERAATSITGQTDVLTFNTGFWDLSNGATRSELSENQYKRRLVGLFGDATVDYKDMLYLNLTARNDWSSTLPLGKPYFYPGATLSYVFTEMMEKNDILSFGKLRLAYGKTGNDASPYFTSTNYVQAYANGYYGSNIASFPMNGVNSFISSTVAGSTSLRPEMTTEQEVGFDLRFLDNRIGLDASFYNRVTSDQIFTLPVDPSTGYSSVVTNFGEVQNRGFELMLNLTPVKTKDLRWDVNLNFAMNKNTVLSMPESLEGGKVQIYRFAAGNDAVYMYAEEGKPMGAFYTYLPKRVEDANSKYNGNLIVDNAGQPILTSDVKYTGFDMNHKWTGGVSTSVTYKNLTLSATLDARYGGKMFSRTKNLMQFTGNGIVTLYNDRKPFVIPNSVQVVTNDDNTVSYLENTTALKTTDGSYQDYFDKYGWGNGGNAYLVDKSFAKLRNITLTYDLPKKLIRPLQLSNVAVSAYVNNAFLWTAADNYYIDPESSTTGTDLQGNFGELYVNPASRIYGFNLSITL